MRYFHLYINYLILPLFQLDHQYYDKYHQEAMKNNNFGEESNSVPNFSDLRIDIHQQVPQINYFHKMVYFHHGKRLLLDDYLQENFKKTIGLIKKK